MKNEELAIIVSVFNRPTYTRRSLTSLLETTKRHVILIDDCSKDTNWKKTYNIIKDHENIEYIRMEKNIGIDDLVKIYPHVTTAEYLYVTDNDMIYSSLFDKKIEQLKRIVEKEPRMIGTLFNSPFHYIDCLYRKNFIIKKSIGGQSVLIKRKTFLTMLKYLEKVEDKSPSWDWTLQQFANKFGYSFISTKKSFVQTIGTWGLHAKPPHVIDYGVDFVK